ncbi:MAG: hypothetical protein IJ004_06190 [Clostridia bacterium]|nr:hypothetical protein [Clostridia bacterium]
MSNKRLTIDELISALELHLTPRTDPEHCEECPFNLTEQAPKTPCEYSLMRECLDALKRWESQTEECYYVKDFVEYTLNSDLPILDTGDKFTHSQFAFILGAAFDRYKRIWEE